MTRIAGLIYAGGGSTRFGANKAEAELQGRRLIDHVANRFEPQVTALAVVGPVQLNNAQYLEDGRHAGKGPLAGLLAGLRWASDLSDVTWLATAPCDVPLLPKNLLSLLSGKRTDRPKVLNIEGRWQTGCALWPTSALSAIEDTLLSGQDLSLHAALKGLHAEPVEQHPDALDGSFANINTQDDLAQLERELSQSNG